jgi:hypothetical protein
VVSLRGRTKKKRDVERDEEEMWFPCGDGERRREMKRELVTWAGF